MNSMLSPNVKYFKIALYVYVFVSLIYNSQLVWENRLVPILACDIFRWISVIFALLSISCVTEKNKLFLFELVLIFLSGIVDYRTGSHLLPVFSLICAGKDICFDTILKCLFKAIGLCMIFLFLLVLLGVISNRVFDKDIPIGMIDYSFQPHGMGFVYFSGFAYNAMALLMIYIYLHPKINLIRVLVLLLLSVIIFMISVTRLQLLICIAFVLLAYLNNKFPHIFGINNIICRFLSLSIYAGSLAFTLISTFFPIFNADMLEDVNTYTNGRYALNIVAFELYPLNLLGNQIKMETSGKFDYFFIDSGYVYNLLGDGLLLFSVVIIATTVLLYRIWKAQNALLFFWCVLFAIANIYNNFLVSILNCPFLFLLFSKKPVFQRKK